MSKCKNCNWKWIISIYKWPTILSPDFIWDKTIMLDIWWIKDIECSVCKWSWNTPNKPSLKYLSDTINKLEKENIKLKDLLNDFIKIWAWFNTEEMRNLIINKYKCLQKKS